MFTPLLKKIRSERPLIHCITNPVTMTDCANILLSAGASPIMARHPEEVSDITGASKALVLNLGATEYFDSMLLSAKEASGKIPIIIDPVGVSLSPFRRKMMKDLLAFDITAVRGNMSEIRAIFLEDNTVSSLEGLDYENDLQYIKDITLRLSEKYNVAFIASGSTDILSLNGKSEEISSGDRMMKGVTGMGCMSSALLGAFLSCENSFSSMKACLSLMGYLGEMAARETISKEKGLGTFHTSVFDILSRL